MWLAEDDILKAEALERTTVLDYYNALNNKIAKTEKVIEENKRRQSKSGGRH